MKSDFYQNWICEFRKYPSLCFFFIYQEIVAIWTRVLVMRISADGGRACATTQPLFHAASHHPRQRMQRVIFLHPTKSPDSREAIVLVVVVYSGARARPPESLWPNSRSILGLLLSGGGRAARLATGRPLHPYALPTWLL